jgi:hypothetical protein
MAHVSPPPRALIQLDKRTRVTRSCPPDPEIAVRTFVMPVT